MSISPSATIDPVHQHPTSRMIDNEEISAEELKRRQRAIQGTEERFLFTNGSTDEDGWRSEALAVIDDIKNFVYYIEISELLPCDENGIYMNIETKEAIRMTVELSSAGFRVCSNQFDSISSTSNNEQNNNKDIPTNNKNNPPPSSSSPPSTPPPSPLPSSLSSTNTTRTLPLNVYYETPYSLLDSISPSYRNSFSNELAQRLMELCK